MRFFVLTVSLITTTFTFAQSQDTVDVVEKTIKVGSIATETEYYGFADGDKVIFNLSIENGKELKDVTISEYPNSVKFADHTINKVENKVLNVARNGVYMFEYYNSNLAGRTIKIKIQRVPKTEKTKFFNTNIFWKKVFDTTYTAVQKQYLIATDTSLETVIDTKAMVHSGLNSEGPRSTIDFILPQNTVSWAYRIGVGNESQEAYQRDMESLSRVTSKYATAINPLAGLLIGVLPALTKAHTGENVQYWFIPNNESAKSFMVNQQFYQYKKGNVITDYGKMEPRPDRQYIGLYNDNNVEPIEVTINIVAMIVNSKYETRIEKVPSVLERMVPFNE